MTLFQSWRFLGSDYPGVGGGTPIFSYIFRFGALFLIQNFRKVILLGVWRVVDMGGEGVGSLRNRTIFYFIFFVGGGGRGAFLNILGLFKFKIQNGIFLDSKISNTFGCAWYSWFFFFFFWGGGGGGLNTVDAGSKPMDEEKMRVPFGYRFILLL